MNKKYLSHLFEAIKQTSGMIEKDKNQPFLPGIKKETTIKSGYHDLYVELKKNNIDLLKNLNKSKVTIQKTLDNNKGDRSLFPVLQKKKTAELQTDLKEIMKNIDNVNTETDYRDNLRMVLNRFFTTGKGIAKRYILLPLNSNFNINQINSINNSSDKKNDLLSKMNDFSEVVRNDRLDNELINYLIKCGYSIDSDEFYKGFCRNDKNVKLKVMDELEKIKKINLTDKKNFLKRLKSDDPLFMNVQQQVSNRERFKESYLERMTIILSDSHQQKSDDVEVVVITWIPRMIMSQSTNTIWTSCMELFSDTARGGSNQHYVMSGIKAGVFIAWLVNLKDMKTINKPIARMLIKPFYSESDDEIIFWPSDLYHDGGTSNLSLFTRTVNRFCYLKQQDRINFDRDVKINILQPEDVYADTGDRDRVIYSFKSLLDSLRYLEDIELTNGFQRYIEIQDENGDETSFVIDIDFATRDDTFFQVLMKSNGYSDQKFLDFLMDRNDNFIKRHAYLIFASALENSKYAIIDFILKENKKDVERYFYKSFIKFFLLKEKIKTASYNLLVFLFNNYIFKYKLYLGTYADEYSKIFRFFLIEKRMDMIFFLLKNKDFFLSYIDKHGFLFLDLVEDQNLKKIVLDLLINKLTEKDIISFKIQRKKADFYVEDLYHLSAFKHQINDKAKVAKLDQIFFKNENDNIYYKKIFIETLYDNKTTIDSYRNVFNEKMFMQGFNYFVELEGKIKEDEFEILRDDLVSVLSYKNIKNYLSENEKQMVSAKLLDMNKLVKLKEDLNDDNLNRFSNTNEYIYRLDFAADKYLDFLVEKKFYMGLCSFIVMTVIQFNDFDLFFRLLKKYLLYIPKGDFNVKSKKYNFLYSFIKAVFDEETKIGHNVSPKTLKDILTFMESNGFDINDEEKYYDLFKSIMSEDFDKPDKKHNKVYFIIDFVLEKMKKNNIKIKDIDSYFLSNVGSNTLTENNKKMYEYFSRFVDIIGIELFFKDIRQKIESASRFNVLSTIFNNEFYFKKILEYKPDFFEDKKIIETIIKKILETNISSANKNFIIKKISSFITSSFFNLIKNNKSFKASEYTNFYLFINNFDESINSINQKNLAESDMMKIFYHVIRKEKFSEYDIKKISEPLTGILKTKKLLNEKNLNEICDHIGNGYTYLLHDDIDDNFVFSNFKIDLLDSKSIEETANYSVTLRLYIEEKPISKIRNPEIYMKQITEMILEITPLLDDNNEKYNKSGKNKKMLNEIIRNLLICMETVFFAVRDNKVSEKQKTNVKDDFLKILNATIDKKIELSSENIDTINGIKWKLYK